ncbi:hypothetical protein F5Y04DRAFT_160895 [Hypomontagnella monticulosa]|nr:hypothetical protein F5Y04DRAFT_160895 [Hypomontagnella monticulosa]
MDAPSDKDKPAVIVDVRPVSGEEKASQVQRRNTGDGLPLGVRINPLRRGPPPPAPPPRRPNVLMICVPGFSTENLVMLTNSRITSATHIRTFEYRPDRLLGEAGSMDSWNDIVQELLDFILASPRAIGVPLSNLSIGFMAADLGGLLVKWVRNEFVKTSRFTIVSTF